MIHDFRILHLFWGFLSELSHSFRLLYEVKSALFSNFIEILDISRYRSRFYSPLVVWSYLLPFKPLKTKLFFIIGVLFKNLNVTVNGTLLESKVDFA